MLYPSAAMNKNSNRTKEKDTHTETHKEKGGEGEVRKGEGEGGREREQHQTAPQDTFLCFYYRLKNTTMVNEDLMTGCGERETQSSPGMSSLHDYLIPSGQS